MGLDNQDNGLTIAVDTSSLLTGRILTNAEIDSNEPATPSVNKPVLCDTSENNDSSSKKVAQKNELTIFDKNQIATTKNETQGLEIHSGWY